MTPLAVSKARVDHEDNADQYHDCGEVHGKMICQEKRIDRGADSGDK